MENKKKALGKGLEQLFSNTVIDFDNFEEKIQEENKNDVTEINIDDIRSNPYQPRKTFDTNTLNELAKSIEEYGVVQPVIVKKSIKGYELIAGERRTKAAKIAGLKKIPAIIKDFDDQEMMEIALIENIQREDLNPYEKALGIRSLMDKYGMTQEEVSKKIGKSRSSVSNTVRVLYLTPDVLELVKQGKLSEGHCKALAGISDPKRQYEAAIRMIEKGESVRQAESKNRITKREKKLDPKYKYLYEDIEDKFQGFFGTKVKLDQGKRKGKIIIEYNGNSDLERILDLLK